MEGPLDGSQNIRSGSPPRRPRRRSSAAVQPEPVDLAGLDDELGYRLGRARSAVFKDLATIMKPFDLTPGVYALLRVLEANPGIQQQRSGEAIGIKRANLVSMVNELEARGVVKRVRSNEDARSYRLYMTNSGIEMMIEIRTIQARQEMGFKTLLGVSNLNKLLIMLEIISRI